MGALFVKLNGPRYWTLDGFGTKNAPVEPITRGFNGIQMRRVATIDLDPEPKFGLYDAAKVDRHAIFLIGYVCSRRNSSSTPRVLRSPCGSTSSRTCTPCCTEDEFGPADQPVKLGPEGSAGTVVVGDGVSATTATLLMQLFSAGSGV